MGSQAEVRESHEQFSAAWSLYARCSGAGEVVDTDGLRIANARQPWFLAGSQQWLGEVALGSVPFDQGTAGLGMPRLGEVSLTAPLSRRVFHRR